MIFFIGGLLSPTKLTAQRSVNSILGEAKKEIISLNYSQAIKKYKEVLDIESNNQKALESLIDIYLYRYEIFDSAEVYINKRMHNMESDTNYLVFFDYANCLRYQERPVEAIEQYLYFKGTGLQKNKYAYLRENVKAHIESCQNAIQNQQIIQKSIDFEVQNMDFFINSVDPEYTPVYIEGDSLLLYNARYKDFDYEETTEDNKYYENIYYFDLEESVASSYNPGIEQDNHHAVVSKSKDNDSILVFYKNKIWVSSIEEDRLNKIEPLPEILSDYFFQPSGIFTNQGNTIIFSASIVPEEEGGDLNIYISNKKNGTWEEPALISPIINSEKDEDAPFLTKDGKTLYFSSKGHNSSGGYDFYKSELVDGKWGYPQNLGYPMNSAGDDIYISLIGNEKQGFFASNRNGGFGGMDIYTFFINEQQKTISGVISNQQGVPLNEAEIVLLNLTDNKKTSVITDSLGTYHFDVEWDKEYEIIGNKENYIENKDAINTALSEIDAIVNLRLEKVKIEDIKIDKEEIGEDLTEIIDIKPIYFDLAKSNIREDAAIELDKIVKVMNANPNMVIELRSHTDARGSDRANKNLSRKRAKSSASYIKERISNPDRVFGEGFGEARLVNECKDGVNCSEEEHQENRRTEFIIVRM